MRGKRGHERKSQSSAATTWTLVLCMTLLLASACALCLADSSGRKSTPEPTVIRHDLHDILSRSEYNRDFLSPELNQSFWDKLVSRIGEFMMRLFGNAGGPTAKIASFVFACLVVVAFLVLVALVAKRLWKYAGEDDGKDDAIDLDGFSLPSARPLINEAARLAEAGDFRGAFRCAYLASISHLDEARALRFERSRTNWEYLRELVTGGFQTPHDQLRPLTLDFDRKFYGGEPCTRKDYENALTAYERITSEVAA